MADEWVPSIETVALSYGVGRWNGEVPPGTYATQYRSEFDAWLEAHDRTERAAALEEAALEADEWQQSHDVAEIAGHVEGETGRQAAIDRWIGLCEDPAAWLRNRAERGE